MILELFFGLLALAIILIFLGEYIRIGTFSIVGYIFIMLLALFVILPSYLHIPQYTDCLEYRIGSNITTTGSTTSIVYVNACLEDSTTKFYLGYLLFFLAFFSMLFLHWIRKKEKQQLKERYQ